MISLHDGHHHHWYATDVLSLSCAVSACPADIVGTDANIRRPQLKFRFSLCIIDANR